MSWNCGPMKFGDMYDHSKDFFDPNEESRRQVQYIMEHPEVQALVTLFIAHMSRKREVDKNKNVLEAAGYFFTREADVLKAEVNAVMTKTGKLGLKEKMEGKFKVDPLIPRRSTSELDCFSPTSIASSNESYYSSFISKSSSVTTLFPHESTVTTPTLEEALWELVIRAFDSRLDDLYLGREHDVNIDGAYLSIMSCVQKAVEAVWGLRVQKIEDIKESLIDKAVRKARERRTLRLLTTNKLPNKVNRLKHDFNGYEETDDYPELQKKEIMETLETRQWKYNRYPKDKFGVYISTRDPSLDVSTTYHLHLHGCLTEKVPAPGSSTDAQILDDAQDVDEDEVEN